MKYVLRGLLILFGLYLLLFIFGRGGFVHDEQITGNYRLIAVDISEQMSVDFGLSDGTGIGRINETVFAVGFDERYIVAKQHPGNNRSITNYYFLDMTLDHVRADPRVSVTGPLTAEEFEKHSADLKLPKFTRYFDNLD